MVCCQQMCWCAVVAKSGRDFEGADQQRCTEVRQNRSARILVSYTPDTDVSFCFNLNYAQEWRYNAAKRQDSSIVDAGFRPVSLLLSNLLLTSTKSHRLAIWHLPSFSQEVQLPQDV